MIFGWRAFRQRWDAFVLRLPLLGAIARDWEMFRFARTMALLLGGGVLVLVVWFLLSLYGARVV